MAFGFLKRKEVEKKSPEVLAAERQARLNETQKRLRVQLLKLEGLKKTYAQKVVEAQNQGMTSQAETAKNMLRKAVKTEKQISGMLMSMELALQTKELVAITQGFVECMNDISADIITDADSTAFKQSKEKLMKAAYKQQKQSEMLDEMLETGNYAMLGETDADATHEFDAEIDMLIQNTAGARQSYGGMSYRVKE